LRSGALETGLDPFGDTRAFEFGYCPENVHLKFSGGRRRVDALVERHKRDAERLELLERASWARQATRRWHTRWVCADVLDTVLFGNSSGGAPLRQQRRSDLTAAVAVNGGGQIREQTDPL
jgi:hypothetical protein